MIPALAVTVGLLIQAAGNPLPARATRAPDPVRVWRADSTAYVTLREPGHLVLLNVDAIGRVGVLFPLNPGDSTSVSADEPFEIPVPPEAQGNPSTLVAVRSRWAFDFAALRVGSTWNYYDALLLQPTAGDPLAALLDIADRVTDGRPYDYGVMTYTRAGTVATRRTPLPPAVCLSCVRRGTGVAAAPGAIPTNAVDCSNASLTNSFCGVGNASISITSVPQMVYQPLPPAAPLPVYVPYYVPIGVMRGEHRRFDRFERFERPFTTPQRSTTAAFPIAPRLVVPSSSDLRTFTGRRH
jgi:hypothetical protein